MDIVNIGPKESRKRLVMGVILLAVAIGIVGTLIFTDLDRPGLKKKEMEAVREFCSAVKKALGNDLVSLRLFGSKARAKARKDSDIDVAVMVRKRNSSVWDKVMDAAFTVNLKWEVYISPRVSHGVSPAFLTKCNGRP